MFKIGQIAKMMETKPHTIRFWEMKFPHIQSQRGNGKMRLYSAENLNEFMKIQKLKNEFGMTLDGIQKLVKDGKIWENTKKIKNVIKKSPEQISLFDEEKKNNSDEIADIKKYNKQNLNEIKIQIDNLIKEIYEMVK